MYISLGTCLCVDALEVNLLYNYNHPIHFFKRFTYFYVFMWVSISLCVSHVLEEVKGHRAPWNWNKWLWADWCGGPGNWSLVLWGKVSIFIQLFHRFWSQGLSSALTCPVGFSCLARKSQAPSPWHWLRTLPASPHQAFLENKFRPTSLREKLSTDWTFYTAL